MSFILDALKKSETERQRQSGPALFEVKIAPPRSRFAVWGAAIGALLLVNVIVVGVVLWHGGASRAAGPAPVPASTAPSVPQVQSNAMPIAAPQVVRPDTRFGARAEAGAAPSAAGAAAGAPSVPASANAAPLPSATPPAQGSPPNTAEAGANADDLAPAVEPPHGNSAQPVTGVMRATPSGLPTYQDAAAEPGANIPSLSLDLHVYSPQADERFVFLNMLKLREGDTSPQGVRVEHITPDGAILSYQGKEFVLQRH